MIKIVGVKITDRIKEIGLTQEILSKHAAVITTRLGFHELSMEICSREAYMLLHIAGDDSVSRQLISELRAVGGIEVHEMSFEENENNNADLPGNSNLRVLGILTPKNHEIVASLQKLFTSYGCSIRTRLGVNETFFGEPAGLIMLELIGDESQMDLLEDDLKKIDKVLVRKIIF